MMFILLGVRRSHLWLTDWLKLYMSLIQQWHHYNVIFMLLYLQIITFIATVIIILSYQRAHSIWDNLSQVQSERLCWVLERGWARECVTPGRGRYCMLNKSYRIVYFLARPVYVPGWWDTVNSQFVIAVHFNSSNDILTGTIFWITLTMSQGCSGYGDSHGDSHGYGYGMGTGIKIQSPQQP